MSPQIKQIRFTYSTAKEIRALPDAARINVGHQLAALEQGDLPAGAKRITSIGNGCYELVVDTRGSWYRVFFYPTKDTVYILYVYQKKSNSIPQRVRKTVGARYQEVVSGG